MTSRLVVHLFVLTLLLPALSACVPYQRYRDVETELGVATRVNTDMISKLKQAELDIARALGTRGITDAKYRALQTRADGLDAESEALAAKNRELEARLSQMAVDQPLLPGAFDKISVPGIEKSADGNQLILASGLLFAAGNSSLKKTARKILDELSAQIRSQYPNHILLIEGHTDNTPIKASGRINKDNWDLGAKRAHAVFQHMVEKGLKKEHFRIYSAGFAEPPKGVDPNSAAGMAKSRRVVIRLGRALG